MMPFFQQKSDRQIKMDIIREGEETIKSAIEVKLKEKKEGLLNDGYTEEQADAAIEKLRDEVSRKAIIFYQNEMRKKKE